MDEFDCFRCQRMHVGILSKHRALLAREHYMISALKGMKTQNASPNFGKDVSCLVYFYIVLKIKYDLVIWAQGCSPECSQIWIVYLRSDSAESIRPEVGNVNHRLRHHLNVTNFCLFIRTLRLSPKETLEVGVSERMVCSIDNFAFLCFVCLALSGFSESLII